MFFKKRKRTEPDWFERMEQKGKVHAHRWIDHLERNTVPVPVLFIKTGMVLILIWVLLLEIMLWNREFPEQSVWLPFTHSEPMVIPQSHYPLFRPDLMPIIDSIRLDPAANKEFDSFLRARPGLEDTFQELQMLTH